MGSHDDKVGVHFHRNVIDVVEEVANAHGGLHVALECSHFGFRKSLKARSRFPKFLFLSHNVNEVEFTLQRLSDSHRVFDGICGHWREVDGNENAVL
jgi:hypothetical protein